MRVLVRVAVAAVVLVALGLGLLALLLPRLAESEAVQRRLREQARQALGREVSWDALSVGLLPPRLVAVGPRVAGERKDDPPQLEARRVDFRLALLPLLARTVVIDSLEVVGVTLRMVRTADGVSLPGAAVPVPGAEPPAAEPAAAPVALAVRALYLSDARVELEDRSLQPPVRWVLTSLEASARGTSLEAPLALEVSGALESGGRIGVEGALGLEGQGELEVTLDGVSLEPLGPYVAGRLAGAASGRVGLRGELADPAEVRWEVRVGEARFTQDELSLRGALASQGELSGGLERGTGSFSADATEAELRYGEVLHKPAGRHAVLSGTLVADPQAGLGIDDLRVALDRLEATGRLRAGRRMRLELDAPSLDVEALAALLPGLAELQPTGTASVAGLVVRTQPLELGGALRVAPLRLALEEGEPIALSGAFEAAGTRVASRDLVARAGGQTIPLELSVGDLAGAPRYRLRARTEGADVEALLRALAVSGAALSGTLDSSATLEGPLAGEPSLLESVRGDSRLEVRDGRLRGVSLLRGSLERLGAIADVALLLGALKGGPKLERFYEDAFEAISGSFRIEGGRARTEDLRLVYRHYTADLRGVYGLVDGALDFTGKLTIDGEVTSALTPGPSGATPPAAAGAGEPAPPEGTEAAAAPPPSVPAERRVIPLAHVGGTLERPRVEITREVALAFATGLAGSRQRTKLEQKLDERLGPGAGREILGTLEGILGGRKERDEPEP